MSPLPFTSSFFSHLTFGETISLTLPPVLPPSSVIHFTWESPPLLSPSSEALLDSEPIPHSDDLKGILREFEVKQRDGYTAVCLWIRSVGSTAEQHLFSLDKIRRVVAVHNNSTAITFSKALFNLVRSQTSTSATWSKIATALMSTPIHSPAASFLTKVPLWSLGCLTWDPEEHEIFDTVVDLRMEATSTRLRLTDSQHPDWILCPSMFIHSLRQLHGQPNQALNRELAVLQQHVRSLYQHGRFGGIVFLDCDGSHWVSYVYNGSSVMEHGDSLGSGHAGPDPRVQTALNWFLDGTGLARVEQVTVKDVQYQGVGSRSCAIAAFNATEMLIGIPGVCRWSPENSNAQRLRWIEDILTHHLFGSSYPDASWYGPNPCEDLTLTDSTDTWENSYAWDCWNVRPLLHDHPFCLAIKAQGWPFVLKPNMSPPPIFLAKKWTSAATIMDEARIASVSPPRSYQANSPSEPPSPFALGSDSDQTTSLPPLPSIRQSDAQVIDITASSPARVPAKRGRSPSIILISSEDDDLLSPPPRPAGKRKSRGGKNKRSRRRSPSIIMISDSDGSMGHAMLKKSDNDVGIAVKPSKPKPGATRESGVHNAETSSDTTPTYPFPPTTLHVYSHNRFDRLWVLSAGFSVYLGAHVCNRFLVIFYERSPCSASILSATCCHVRRPSFCRSRSRFRSGTLYTPVGSALYCQFFDSNVLSTRTLFLLRVFIYLV